MQNDKTTVEKQFGSFLKKLKQMIAIGPSHAIPRYLPTRSESISHTKICPWMLMAASLTALNCKQPNFHCGIIMQLNCCYLVTKLCLTLLRFPWTVAHQAPLSIGFSKQEYWSGLPFLPPGDLSNPEMKPRSPALQADSILSDPPVQFSSVQSLSFVRLFVTP